MLQWEMIASKNSSKTKVFALNVMIMINVLCVLTQQNVHNVIRPSIGFLILILSVNFVYAIELIIRMIRINVYYVSKRDVISVRSPIRVSLALRKKGLSPMLLGINALVKLVSI